MGKKDFEDPYGISKMSDEEFLEKLPMLRKKARGNGYLGGVLLVIGVLLLVVLWGEIF